MSIINWLTLYYIFSYYFDMYLLWVTSYLKWVQLEKTDTKKARTDQSEPQKGIKSLHFYYGRPAYILSNF